MMIGSSALSHCPYQEAGRNKSHPQWKIIKANVLTVLIIVATESERRRLKYSFVFRKTMEVRRGGAQGASVPPTHQTF